MNRPNHVNENHQQFQQNQRQVSAAAIERFFKRFFIFVDIVLLVSGIVLLVMDWNESCNKNIKYWIIVQLANMVLFRLFTWTKKCFGEDTYKRLERYFSLFGLGIYIWGWVWYAAINECQADHLQKFMLANLIIITIFLFLPIILLLLGLLCLPCLVSLASRLPREPAENALNQQQVLQLPEYTFNNGNISNGQTIIPIPDVQDRMCCICLEQYQNQDKIRNLPCNQNGSGSHHNGSRHNGSHHNGSHHNGSHHNGSHHMHMECCDEWLKINGTCPICRTPVKINSMV